MMDTDMYHPAGTPPPEDDDLDVVGYIYTHADCPLCNEPNEYEGDCSGDEVTCAACNMKFSIREVR